MFGNQNTIPQERRYQDTYEDRTCGIQQRLPYHETTRTHAADVRDNPQPPSHGYNQRQAQLHSPHRLSTPFLHGPFRQAAAVASTSSQRSCPEAAHSAVSGHHPDISSRSQWPCPEAAHSAATGNDPDDSSTTIVTQYAASAQPGTAFVGEPVPKKRTRASTPSATFGPLADNATAMLRNQIRHLIPADVSASVRYDATTQRVHLPSGLQDASCQAESHRSAAVHTPAQRPDTRLSSSDNGRTLVNDRHPGIGTPPLDETGYSDLPATAFSTSKAAASTAAETSHAPAVAADSVANNVMPSCASPTNRPNGNGKDRRTESAFYRNAAYTRSSNNDAAPPPFVLIEPPIEPFDGDVRTYPRFRDRFVDIIEAQPYLEPRHKLLYLLQYLRGEPLQMADRLRYTDDNYFAVLDLLEERYGDQHRLSSLLIQDLIHLPAPPSTKLSDMTRFHDDIFQIVSDLRPLLGMNIDEPNNLLAEVLLGKLPHGIRWSLLTETICADDRSLDGLLSGLKHLIRQTRLWAFPGQWFTAGSRLDEDPDMNVRKDPNASSNHASCDDRLAESVDSERDKEVHEAAEHSAVAENAFTEVHLKERRTCPLCGLLHTAARCTSFNTINRRLRRIKKLELCLLCLREGHKAVTCPRRTTDSCRICHKGPHNRAVCMTANGRIRSGNRRRSPVCATTGSSVDPQRSDHQRHARKKKSVGRADATRASTATKLRQSETQSSSKSTPKRNRKKRSKKRGAAPQGPDDTSRPSTTSTAESMKQKTADACGDGRLLPARQGRLPTDRCSKPDESAQFYRTNMDVGTARTSDAVEQHELRETEEDSSSESSGDYSDTLSSTSVEPLDSTKLQPPEGVFCASNIGDTTLFECIKVTAANPVTGVSRDVIVFFDSGSSRSFTTTNLARDLDLPRHAVHRLFVSTFGSELTTAIEGFSTSIVLSSHQRCPPPLEFIAHDCIVPSVLTALVEHEALPMLRRNDCALAPTNATPDILIGQDLVSNFQRHQGRPLPSGFYVINSILGPMVGGSGKVATNIHASAPTTSAAIALTTSGIPCSKQSPPVPLDASIRHPSSTSKSLKLQKTTRQGRHLTSPITKCTAITSNSASTHSVGADAFRSRTNDEAFSHAVEKNNIYRGSTSIPICEARHTLSDRTVGSRPRRKHPNPLDTTAPLPPLISTIHVSPPSDLRMDPSALMIHDQAPDCRHTSSQPSSALTTMGATRPGCLSLASSRSVPGTKNYEELRLRDVTHNVRYQPGAAIDAVARHAMDARDPVRHTDQMLHHALCGDLTPSGAHFSEVVMVAVADDVHADDCACQPYEVTPPASGLQMRDPACSIGSLIYRPVPRTPGHVDTRTTEIHGEGCSHRSLVGEAHAHEETQLTALQEVWHTRLDHLDPSEHLPQENHLPQDTTQPLLPAQHSINAPSTDPSNSNADVQQSTCDERSSKPPSPALVFLQMAVTRRAQLCRPSSLSSGLQLKDQVPLPLLQMTTAAVGSPLAMDQLRHTLLQRDPKRFFTKFHNFVVHLPVSCILPRSLSSPQGAVVRQFMADITPYAFKRTEYRRENQRKLRYLGRRRTSVTCRPPLHARRHPAIGALLSCRGFYTVIPTLFGLAPRVDQVDQAKTPSSRRASIAEDSQPPAANRHELMDLGQAQDDSSSKLHTRARSSAAAAGRHLFRSLPRQPSSRTRSPSRRPSSATARRSEQAHSARSDLLKENPETGSQPAHSAGREPQKGRVTKREASGNKGTVAGKHMTIGSSQHPFVQDRHQQCTARRESCAPPTDNQPGSPLDTVLPDLANTIDDYPSTRYRFTIDAIRRFLADNQVDQETPSSSVHSAGTDAARRDKRAVQCAYCGRQHFSGRCNLYVTVAQRLKRLRQLNHCLLCLRPGHWSDSCPSRKEATCKHCANPHAHHVSLCRAYVHRGQGLTSVNPGTQPLHSAPAAQTAPKQRKKSKPKVCSAPPATRSGARGANPTGRSANIGSESKSLEIRTQGYHDRFVRKRAPPATASPASCSRLDKNLFGSALFDARRRSG